VKTVFGDGPRGALVQGQQCLEFQRGQSVDEMDGLRSACLRAQRALVGIESDELAKFAYGRRHQGVGSNKDEGLS
jgi:hypothetical protein